MSAKSFLDHRVQMHRAQGVLFALDVESLFVNVLKYLPSPLAMNAQDLHKCDAP